MLAHRNGRELLKPMSMKDAWRTPSASAEARHCFAIAQANGGIEHMRELISVSRQERRELFAWAAGAPSLAVRIEKMLLFRDAVLFEFNRLATLKTSLTSVDA